jgi:hypothetical protein
MIVKQTFKGEGPSTYGTHVKCAGCGLLVPWSVYVAALVPDIDVVCPSCGSTKWEQIIKYSHKWKTPKPVSA